MHAPLRVSSATESVSEEHGLASATLAVTWADARAVHEDQLHVDRFSVWREIDLLPH